jgi:hypothetical protein
MGKSVTLANGQIIIITPPTGLKLIIAAVWFGIRLRQMRGPRPTDPAGIRRVAEQVATTVAPYVSGATAAQLRDAFIYDPRDMSKVAMIAQGKLSSR